MKEHEPRVNEGEKVRDIFRLMNVGCLDVDAVEHADHVTVDDCHFIGEGASAFFSVRYLGILLSRSSQLWEGNRSIHPVYATVILQS